MRLARRAAAEADEVEAARDRLAELAGSKAEGQGYASFSDRRKAIEGRAMNAATSHFRGLGYTVRDVSARRSYDLECTRRNATALHVEVKGTTSRGASILLTANELKHVQAYPNTALFVLHSIRVNGTPPVARGGQVVILNPWEVAEERLEPLAFSYQLP